MKIFHDWEFLEDGRTIDWISVGMVRSDDAELYLVNADMNAPRIADHPWLMANVVPHLPLLPGVAPTLDRRHPAVVDTVTAADRIAAFIQEPLAIVPEVELWAWYGAYDHVRLAQMWGPMRALPHGIPMVTHDIMTLELIAGRAARDARPPQEGEAHHALADARHNRRLHDHYMGALMARMDRKMTEDF